jgi:hypothetical protein
MPGPHEVEGWRGRAEPTDVKDSCEASVGYDHVARYQVPIGHPVGRLSGQLAQTGPHPTESGHVEQLLALLHPHLHTLVVRPQIPAAVGTGKGATADIDGTDLLDERSEVAREPR